MRRLFLLWFACAATLATGQDTTGREAGFFDLAVPGGQAGYESLGFAPEERGVALWLLARQLYGQGSTGAVPAARRLAATLDDAPGVPGPPGFTIAAPITASAWREALEPPAAGSPRRGPLPPEDLFRAIVSSRAALLVAAGATEADASIREWLDHDRGLLRFLVRTAPGAFLLAAPALRLADGRIAAPGGPEAAPIWETLAGEQVSRPAAFLRTLVTKDAGRLAWFYGTLGAMPEDRLVALLPPAPDRLEQARLLYSVFRDADANWRLEDHPYLRSMADPWLIVTHLGVREGRVAPPAQEWLWRAVFDRKDVTRNEVAAAARGPSAPARAAWMAQQIALQSPRERRDRYEMVRFAQGVFGGARPEDDVELAVAIGGYRRFRAALLALDRMGLAGPRAYARVVEAARRAEDRPGREQRDALVALQSALAIVARARWSHALDPPAAERLVLALADAVDRDVPTTTAVAEWIRGPLMAALPRLGEPDRWTGTTAYESTILQAMAGPAEEPSVPAFTWEGLTYDVDLAGWERERLARIRRGLESPGLDAALASGRAGALADALMALAYTPALGDPDGPALLGPDVASRHDFGFGAVMGSRREHLAWLPPRDRVGDGAPWHVEGALVGMELGLARLALRRLVEGELPDAPTINLNDEVTLARAAAAMNPRELADRDRDEVAAAIGRGRARVEAAGRDVPRLAALAAEARLSPAVRQTLPWLAARAPEAVPSLFALRDLLWLGFPALDEGALGRWGAYREPIDSRWRTAMPRPAPWDGYGGRPDGGVIATQSPDLTLRLVLETARLGVPAPLVPFLLQFATLDYWHDVKARFPDDYPALTRQAAALESTRVEDYVAALAANGPLRAK